MQRLTLRNEFWYLALDVDKLFDLDTDKGIEDAREKLREQRDQFTSLAGVTEQEKMRIQAMNNQDNWQRGSHTWKKKTGTHVHPSKLVFEPGQKLRKRPHAI